MCCSVRPGFAVDLVEEADELLVPMAAHALTCQFPRGSRQFTATPCRARRLLTDNQPVSITGSGEVSMRNLPMILRRTSIPRSAPGSNGIRGSIFHFTPISASWLNAVEGFFAKLTKHRLKRGVFKGIAPDAIIEKKSGERKRCWHRLAERFPGSRRAGSTCVRNSLALWRTSRAVFAHVRCSGGRMTKHVPRPGAVVGHPGSDPPEGCFNSAGRS
jgi:hypothetical protein